MEYKEEYLCGSEELEKILDINDLLLILSFLVFIAGVFIGMSCAFIICLIGFVISTLAFAIIEPSTDEADRLILERYVKAAKKSKNILLFFLLIATFIDCYAFPWEEFNMRYIPGCVFFVLNIILFFNYNHIKSISKNLLKNFEYKENLKEEIYNISSRVAKTVKVAEEMFYGLEEDEKDILRPCVVKLIHLFMLSYDNVYNIKNPNMFYDIESFILKYGKTINAYKKGKGSSDLDFLERLNNSAEELYFTLNSKEQALRKDNFENKMYILKIKLNQVCSRG